MKIYRSIALNENETINTDNLGCSWSLSDVYPHDHAEKNIIPARGLDGYIIIEADVNLNDIDIDNTLFALENREDEAEVVINSIDLKAEVVYSDLESIKEGTIIEGLTGCNEFEDYTNEYDGDLTVEDFIDFVNEVQ